ncbi:hypothetical protein SAMN05216411_1193 [Nitrosospira multiformis]|nr:hypothetical protein SAMN05216411_1193 [Nitrosospira multiformis]
MNANFFTFTGENVKVTYRIGGNPGFIALTYDDTANPLMGLNEGFKPAQIDTVQTPLGIMVTVVIRTSIDTGSTSFSIFVPDINVPYGQSANFTTIGVYKDVRGLIIFPKDLQITWSCVQFAGEAESIFIPC